MTLLALAIVLTVALQWSLSAAPEFWERNRGRRIGGALRGDPLDPGLVRHHLRRPLDRLHPGRMMLHLKDVIGFIEDNGLADAVRENDLLFPLIESVHVLAICLVVGSIMAVDLRLLGVAWMKRPVSAVTRGILPLTWGAFVVAVGIRLSDVHVQRHQISRQRFFRRQALSDRRRRAQHAGVSFHQRKGSAAVGQQARPPLSRRGWQAAYRCCFGSRWSRAAAGSALRWRPDEMIARALLASSSLPLRSSARLRRRR